MKVELLTKIAIVLCRFLSRVSDGVMLSIFKLAKLFIGDPAMSSGLDELIDMLKAGPPNTTLLKKILAETRPDEIHELMFGMFGPKEIDLEKL